MELVAQLVAQFLAIFAGIASRLDGIPLAFQAVLAGFAADIAGLAASPLAGFPRLMARPTPPALDARKRRSYQNQRNQQEFHATPSTLFTRENGFGYAGAAKYCRAADVWRILAGWRACFQ
jgi:hypothetical protein